jgi:hypothetical protein
MVCGGGARGAPRVGRVVWASRSATITRQPDAVTGADVAGGAP